MPEKNIRNKLLHYLNPQPTEQILEFGFGTAQNIILAKQSFPNLLITGVDIDPQIQSIAEYKLQKARISAPLFLYDGNTLPFPDNHFDKVFSCLVFHQLNAETKASCLKELYRVLKPSGILLIGDWGKAQNLPMRIAFYCVQLLDGFKTTQENVEGMLPNYIREAGFSDAFEIDHINTAIGTFSYYRAIKL